MAVGADGKIWFGTQWEGDPLETPSLVGRASLEDGLELVATPEPELNDMRRYVGAMAASRDGTFISASAPRGGYVVHFSAETGRYVGRTEIADSSGITGYGEKSDPRLERRGADRGDGSRRRSRRCGQRARHRLRQSSADGRSLGSRRTLASRKAPEL